MSDTSDNSNRSTMVYASSQRERPSQIDSQTQIESLFESENSDNDTGSDISYDPNNPGQNVDISLLSDQSDDGRSLSPVVTAKQKRKAC